MARKKDSPPEDTLLVSAAKAIGTAAGKVAHIAGAAPAPPKPKKGKLQPKNKKRLPRKVKKAQKKTAAH